MKTNLYKFRGVSRDTNEIIEGNYFFDGAKHYIDKCFQRREEVIPESITQSTGLISIDEKDLFFNDHISFKNMDGFTFNKKVWFSKLNQCLMIGDVSYDALRRSRYIEFPLKFTIIQK